MSKFKVGDVVRRIRGDHKGMYPGNTDIVKYVSRGSGIGLEYYGGCEGDGLHDSNNFELVKESKMFNVDEFRTGQRVVYRNGEVGIVLKDIKVIGLVDGFNNLPTQEEFEEDWEGWNIDEVYQGFTTCTHVLNFKMKGALLWKREVETEAQKRVKELEQTILNAQKQLAELKKEI